LLRFALLIFLGGLILKELFACVLSVLVFVSTSVFAEVATSPRPVAAITVGAANNNAHEKWIELAQQNQALAEQVAKLQEQVDMMGKDQERLASTMDSLRVVFRSMAVDYLNISNQFQHLSFGYRVRQMFQESPLTTTGSFGMVILLLGVLLYLFYRDRQKALASRHFSGEDEIRGQLDLARTYIGMGDHKRAQELLKYAAKRGSTAQRSEATQLLQTITVK
jgi:FimV-like protein